MVHEESRWPLADIGLQFNPEDGRVYLFAFDWDTEKPCFGRSLAHALEKVEAPAGLEGEVLSAMAASHPGGLTKRVRLYGQSFEVRLRHIAGAEFEAREADLRGDGA